MTKYLLCLSVGKALSTKKGLSLIFILLLIVNFMIIQSPSMSLVAAQGSDLDTSLAQAAGKGYLSSLVLRSDSKGLLANFYLTDQVAASDLAQELISSPLQSYEITAEDWLDSRTYQITALLQPDNLTLTLDVQKPEARWQIVKLNLPDQTDITSAADASSSQSSQTASQTEGTPAGPTEIIFVGQIQSDLNVRRGPGITYDVQGGLGSGDEVQIEGISEDKGWYLASQNGAEIGWISSRSDLVNVIEVEVAIEAPAQPDETTADKMAPEKAEEADTEALTGTQETTETLLADTNTSADGKAADDGETSSDDGDESDEILYANAKGRILGTLPVYLEPNIDSEAVMMLAFGNEVDVIGLDASKQWYQVAQDGIMLGWLATDSGLVSLIPAKMSRTATTLTSLDVYRAPAANSAINGSLDQGEVVDIIGVSMTGSWYQIAQNGEQLGWISARPDLVSTEASMDESGETMADEIMVDEARASSDEAEAMADEAQTGDEATAPAKPSIPVMSVDTASSASTNSDANAAATPNQANAEIESPSSPAPAPTSTSNILIIQPKTGEAIYQINPDGSGLRLLTTGIDPALSPDKTKLAFTRWGGDERGALFIYDLTTGQETEILGEMFEPKSPTWSPDGTRIMINFQNGGRREIEERCVAPNKGNQIPRGAYDINVGSETGRICYKLFLDTYWQLRRVDPATGGFEDMASDRYSFAPTWHPAKPWQVLFSGAAGLLILDVDQNQYTDFFALDVRDRAATFSPDGSRVALTYKQDTFWEVYTLDANTGARTRLTKPSILGRRYSSAAPAWSPDGSQIVFVTDRSGRWEFWIMDANGDNQRPLFSTEVASQLDVAYRAVDERLVSWR